MAKETTAIEWLSEKYNYITWMRNRDEMSPETADKLRQDYLEQAKQMEKREKRLDIISAFESGKLMEKANSNKTGDEYYFCNYIDNE